MYQSYKNFDQTINKYSNAFKCQNIYYYSARKKLLITYLRILNNNFLSSIYSTRSLTIWFHKIKKALGNPFGKYNQAKNFF